MTGETSGSADAAEVAEAGEGTVASESNAPAKAAPQRFALRARPAPVVRLRRGPVIALAGAGAVFLVAVGWFAFGSSSPNPTIREDNGSAAAAKSVPDALAGAPTSYADVAPLGPPLPGDLGRAIVARQRQEGSGEPVDPARNAEADEAARAARQAETERRRLAAERRAARESGVMLSLAGPAARPPRTPPASVETPAPATVAASGNEPDANGQRRKNALVGRASGGDDVNPHRLEAAVSPWTLQAGSVIAASLITGLNSDLPGIVTAQVTENAYDSVTGRTLLLPQGSRLIGSYDSVVAFGQSRALVVWQRIILPDGSSIRIDNVPASDTEGYAGLADRIDRHTWQLLKGVALSTLLGVGTELGWGSSESDLVRAIRESTQQAGSRAGDQLVARNLDVQPTLKVRPGWPLRVVVHKDIVLRPWRGGYAR